MLMLSWSSAGLMSDKGIVAAVNTNTNPIWLPCPGNPSSFIHNVKLYFLCYTDGFCICKVDIWNSTEIIIKCVTDSAGVMRASVSDVIWILGFIRSAQWTDHSEAVWLLLLYSPAQVHCSLCTGSAPLWQCHCTCMQILHSAEVTNI